MKYILWSISIMLACALGSGAQTPTPTVTQQALSARVAASLEAAGDSSALTPEKRARAYAKLLEAQRNIWRLRNQRTQAGRTQFSDLAKTALIESLAADPFISESYVALAEVELMKSQPSIEESAALASLAVKLNKDSIGGHRFLARLLTKQSGVRIKAFNMAVAARAIEEWREVTRLDPRNAEAWAMLGELYSRIGKPAEEAEAYRHWMASTSPVDTVWYQVLEGGQGEDLMPENAGPRLAAALVTMKKPEEAIRVLADLLSDDPGNYQLFADVREAAASASSDSEALAMLEPIQKIVIANPESIDLLVSFAKLRAQLGDVNGAIKMLADRSAGFRADQRAAAANTQLAIGDVLMADSRISEASAAYERSLSIRGLDQARTMDADEREFAANAFDKLITGYKRAGKLDDAKAAIQRARKLFGDSDPFADRQLIELYRESGDRAGALAAVSSLRQKNPNDITLLRQEAMLRMESGQIEQAAALIQQRIDSAKNGGGDFPRLDDDFSNYIYLSQLYNEAGRGTEAAAAAQKALAVAGGDDRRQIAMLMTATAYNTARQFDRSEAILREILKASPRNPIALNNLGYFLLERGERYSEALELIERAVQIDPTNPSYLDSLGWAQFKNGMLDQALRTLNDAAKYSDSSANIQEHLGDVYAKKGDTTRAKEAWQRAAQLMFDPADLARVREKIAGNK